ncbi:MAG: 30S ribosomal protein S13 [Thermoplasmata archaeon]
MAEEEESSEFKYIVRLANTDLDGNRPMVYALAGIKGVGLRLAQMITDMLGVPRTMKIGDISDEQVEELAAILDDLSNRLPTWALNRRRDFWSGEDQQIIGSEVDMRRREDVNRMKMIRCYRGIRHETGQKVRGQRTRSNGRTGLTVGVTRRAGRGGQPGQRR